MIVFGAWPLYCKLHIMVENPHGYKAQYWVFFFLWVTCQSTIIHSTQKVYEAAVLWPMVNILPW